MTGEFPEQQDQTAGGGSAPYGPGTIRLRRFLVRLASLGNAERDSVVRAYELLSNGRPWMRAELALAEAIERGGRADARDALAGPLLQLVRLPDAELSSDEAMREDTPALQPIAEAALAAVLALLVEDLLDETTVQTLYAPFEAVIPRMSF